MCSDCMKFLFVLGAVLVACTQAYIEDMVCALIYALPLSFLALRRFCLLSAGV
jgi:hypothetical protein